MTTHQAGPALLLLATLACSATKTLADDRVGQVSTVAVPGGGKPVLARVEKEGVVHLLLALTASDGSTLVAWKKDDRLGWQRYGVDGEPSGPPGSSESPRSGAAGVIAKDGGFLLFR